MRRLTFGAVCVAAVSIWPTAASAITFAEWATAQDYSPGAVMPGTVNARSSSIDSLDGIGDYDWTTTPTTTLYLNDNQLSSIEPGAFDGLTNLTNLSLSSNQLSSIEAGDFSGLTNLTSLHLWNNQLLSIEAGDFEGLTNLTGLSLRNNQLTSIEAGAVSGLPNLAELYLRDNPALTDLNLAEADFSSLNRFDIDGNVNITRVSLNSAVVNQHSLATLMDGGTPYWADPIIGIGEQRGNTQLDITELDLSGIDFAAITDLAPLYVMDDVTDLWLADTQNLDATALDVLLDNLATIEGTDVEGVLYMARADFNAFNAAVGGLLAVWDAEPGHHVAIIPEPGTLELVLVCLFTVCGSRRSR